MWLPIADCSLFLPNNTPRCLVERRVQIRKQGHTVPCCHLHVSHWTATMLNVKAPFILFFPFFVFFLPSVYLLFLCYFLFTLKVIKMHLLFSLNRYPRNLVLAVPPEFVNTIHFWLNSLKNSERFKILHAEVVVWRIPSYFDYYGYHGYLGNPQPPRRLWRHPWRRSSIDSAGNVTERPHCRQQPATPRSRPLQGAAQATRRP